MFIQLVPFVTLATFLIPVPVRAVPGAAWIRRQEDAQSSLTLDPAVISPGLAQDGQGDNPADGQVRSLTSTNNFINFCEPFLDQGVPLTNGQQITGGSCNPVPMGRIIGLDLAPRCKFVFPKNGDESIEENTPFTVQMKLLNMEAGNFVNAQTNYYAAPQQVNSAGILIGHTHFVIEPLPSLQTTEPLDPLKFAFFKGINEPVDGNNIVQTTVSNGLSAGIYRICSINTSANHQPALVSNAQHGSLDDCSYFTVKAAGQIANTSTEADEATATASASAEVTESVSESESTSDAATTSAPEATETTSVAEETDEVEATASPVEEEEEEVEPTESSPEEEEQPEPTEPSTEEQQEPEPTSASEPTNATGDAPEPTESVSVPDNGDDNDNEDNNGEDNGEDNGEEASPAPTEETPAPSEDASPEPAPEDATPEDPASEEPAPEDVTPEDPASEEPAPEDVTPEAPASEEPAPEDSTPEVPTSEEPDSESQAPSQENENDGSDGDDASADDNSQGENDEEVPADAE